MVNKGNERLLFKTILTELIKASHTAGLLEEKLAGKVISFLSGLGRLEELEMEFFGFNLIAKANREQLDEHFPYTILRDGLNDFLRLVTKRGGGKAVQGAILLLDEGDVLTLNRNLLQILRNVFQETPRVGLVIAGSTRLLSQVSDVFSPIPRFFRKIELGAYPADSVVYDAIRVPLDLSTKELADQGISVEFVHPVFDRIVTRIAGRMPMEINMLCHFAYDLAAKRIPRTFRFTGSRFTLYLKAEKELFEEAIKQLGGTKEYATLISKLDKNETSCLVLLSKSLEEATVDEIAVLMTLHDLGDALQEMSVIDVTGKIAQAVEDRGKITRLLGSINAKALEHKIGVLSSTLMGKPRFAVEDQWVRSYFKYGWTDIDVDLDMGLKPRFGGIRVFGDPIATVVHSMFFPRLAKGFGGDSLSFRAHVGHDDGNWLIAGRDRKILNLSYTRTATESRYHIAFQVKQEFDLEGIVNAIKILMEKIQDAGLVTSFNSSIKRT